MRQAGNALAWIFGAFALLLLGGFAWGRLRAPDEAQADALALLHEDRAPAAGRNAWPLFWLLDYDMPAGQVDAVYAREREHLKAWLARAASESPGTPYEPLAARDWHRLPAVTAADRARLCQATDPDDCLDKVRKQGQPLRELLARQAARLARLRAVTAGDVLWDDLPPGFDVPFPPFGQAAGLRQTAAALAFSDGRREPALAEVCAEARTLRHLHAHTNSLVGAMATAGMLASAERLFAGMLAELPPEQALPPDCAEAFAPVTLADLDLCAPLQREYQLASSPVVLQPSRRSYRHRLLVDPQGTRRLLAPRYAWACRADVHESAMADRKLPDALAPAVRPDRFDYLSNPMGVILARIAGPDYVAYQNANEDHAAGLRLAALLVHTRDAGPPAGWHERFEEGLATLRRQGGRSYRIDADGRHVRMSYHAPRPGRSELVWPLMR